MLAPAPPAVPPAVPAEAPAAALAVVFPLPRARALLTPQETKQKSACLVRGA